MILAIEPLVTTQDARVTVPNGITVVRVIMGFASANALISGDAIWAVAWYLGGLLTDVLDGFAARSLKQVTQWGKWFDGVADVIFNCVTSAAVIWVAIESPTASNTYRAIAVLLVGAMYGARRVIFHRGSLASHLSAGVGRLVLFIVLWTFLETATEQIILASCGICFFSAAGVYEFFVSWEDWRTGRRPIR